MMIVRKKDLVIVPFTHEVLNRAPKPYNFEEDGSTAQMFANVLFDKMKELRGVGLSANQLGLDVSVFVMGFDDKRFDVFNPKIISTQGSLLYEEGCLTFPGMHLKVTRPESVEVEYFNAAGEKIACNLTGLAARIFLHEYDHMQGITIKKKVSQLKWNIAEKKRKKFASVAEKQQAVA
jgi:peptide deformylase